MDGCEGEVTFFNKSGGNVQQDAKKLKKILFFVSLQGEAGSVYCLMLFDLKESLLEQGRVIGGC